MTYEIKPSAHGPITMYQGKAIALHEYVDLFDLIDNYENYLPDITSAVVEHLSRLSLQFEKDIKDYYRTDPSRFNSREVVADYNNLVYMEYPKYRMRLAGTLLKKTDQESVASLNPDHVNKFYDELFNKNRPM
jgi:hypothetical protein